MSDADRVAPSPGAVLDALPDPVVTMRADGSITGANRRLTEVLGWDVAEITGRSMIDYVHPDDVALALASLETVGDKDSGELMALRARHRDGGWRRLEAHGRLAALDGEEGIVLVLRDLRSRHGLELDGGDTDVLRAVMSSMHAMVALVEPDGDVRSINGAVTRVLGYDPELVAGRGFLDVVHPDDHALVEQVVGSLRPGTSVHLDARFLGEGERGVVTCEFTITDLTGDPTVGAYLVSGQVASALSDARQRAAFLAEHDPRTGLLNRDGFLRAAGELVERGGGLGLLIVDIVQFRSINELYGERAGDRVLAGIAARLDAIELPDLVAARFGGDEFVLALRSGDERAMEALAERIRRDVSSTPLADELEIEVAVRTAVAWEPVPRELDPLLAGASSELMRAKRRAAHDAVGVTGAARTARRRHLDQLKSALRSGRIQPFYQPIVSASGRVLAVEALVRWLHPVRGVLGVGEILPLAQLAGLAEAVDDRVLDHALALAARLAGADRREVEVHVNVDPKVISAPGFATGFLRRCELAGADPAQLVVELTETDLLAPGVGALDNMHQLRRVGVKVTIDDFGTGYSSLSHLLELPIDGVKIDRRFVAGIDVDRAATDLTTAIVHLSQSLGLGCVAEGVEQPYQLERLDSLGCRAFQGWLFSRAVAADDLLAMLPIVEPLDDLAPAGPTDGDEHDADADADLEGDDDPIGAAADAGVPVAAQASQRRPS